MSKTVRKCGLTDITEMVLCGGISTISPGHCIHCFTKDPQNNEIIIAEFRPNKNRRIAAITPYRPQTNGKVERFWRSLNEDLITGTYFESIEDFKKELHDYLLYYNKLRPHQGIDGKTPEAFAENCQRIT